MKDSPKTSLIMANKLYELLAVEQDRKHKGYQAIGETRKAFAKADVQFDGMLKRYIPLEENAEQVPDEQRAMLTTVRQKLEQTLAIVAKGLNANLAKEETNASGTARAELVVEDQSFGEFSATSLLALEGHLQKLRELYAALPVLDTAKKWIFNEQEGIYQTEPEVKFRSVKRPKVVVKYEATKEHPAQTELLNLDFQVGKYETIYSSGKITVAQKALLLSRVNTFLEAVKIARSRANTVEVQKVELAEELFTFLHRDVFE